MSQDEYEDELTAGRDEIAAVLEGVADGVRAGAVRLGDGPDAVSVELPDDLTLEIELEAEEGETSLELEMEWTAEGDASPISPIDDADAAAAATGEEAGEDAVDSESETGSGTDAASEDAEPAAVDDVAPTLAGAADGPESLARFEIYQDSGAEWRWRLRHRNGNIIATSGEGYTRKHNALKGLRSVMANSPAADVTDESTT